MTIPEQLALFFKKIREPQANSRLTAEEALTYINDHRRSEALETKFYDVTDTITADGGETYWTMRGDLQGLQDARDCVTCNGKPVVIRRLANWADLTSGAWIDLRLSAQKQGMLHGNTFYIYPAAAKGDVMKWWGYGEPPALPAVTGGDAYLNNSQAELSVLSAAIAALEDLGETAGPELSKRYMALRKIVRKKAAPPGPRLEQPPDE